MRKIIIEQGNEFKIYSREAEINEDIFNEQYEQADSIKESLKSYCSRGEQTGAWEYLNNVIAFCGDRGQGKSSAVIQFTYHLKKDAQLEVLETIDPTAMEAMHDILDIVISRMFDQFRIRKENGELTGSHKDDGEWLALDQNKKLHMSKLFQKVHKNLAVLKNSDKFIKEEYIYNGSIQNLADITDSMKLKSDVEELVREFLRLKKKKQLVVALDDLDLNISAAYKMMEQIRKYLMIPEIIIIMAVNISQLSLCVERQFLLDMKGLEQSVRWDMHLEARRMANKYLEKLLPLPRRILLPDIRTISSGGKSAVEIVYQNNIRVIFDSKELGIEKGMMQLLYQRTGLILVAEEDEVHPMVPGTLRELVSLFSVIGNMGKECCRRNMELFEDYLFGSWTDNNLREVERQWFITLRSLRAGDIHNVIFLYLHDLLLKNEYPDMEESSSDQLGKNINKTYSAVKEKGRKVSYGELLNCIRFCMKAHRNDYNKLLFALQAFLSSFMLKLKYENEGEKLIEFIGDNVFGSILLIRMDSGAAWKRSRMCYNYDLKEYWGVWAERLKNIQNITDIKAEKYTVAAVSQYFDQYIDGHEILKQSLYAAGCVSEFNWTNDSDAQGLVADNNLMAARVSFSLNQLFIRQLHTEAVYRNINGEKWGFTDKWELEDGMPDHWKYFNTLCNVLLCNMEAVRFVSKYISADRKIKDSTNDDIHVYYGHFFDSLLSGMEILDQYLGLNMEKCDKTILKREYGKLADDLAMFWESRAGANLDREEAEDRELSIETDVYTEKEIEETDMFQEEGLKLPSYLRKDSSLGNLKRKYEILKKYIKANSSKFSDVKYSWLEKRLINLQTALDEYSKKHSDNEIIDSSLADQYKTIRDRLLG